MLRNSFAFLIGFLLFSNSFLGFAQGEVIGILGALPQEIALLEERMEHKEEVMLMGLRFYKGKLSGKDVVLAKTGVGKVNAAITSTLMLEHFKPGNLVFTGIAGGLGAGLVPGDIVVSTQVAQHDLGTFGVNGIAHFGVINPVDGQRNPVFFPADAALLAVAKGLFGLAGKMQGLGEEGQLPTIQEGTIVTGDVFLASEAQKEILIKDLGADAVEMEGAAVAQVCWQYKVPFLIIRSISDGAGNEARMDFEAFANIAAENSAKFLLAFLAALPD